MLVLLRIVFTALLIYVFRQMWLEGQTNPESGDLMQAFYMGLVLILAICMAAVWAPFLGERIADPITGELTKGSYGNRLNLLPRLIEWLDLRGHRRLTLLVCILEGIDRPDMPLAFVVGLKNTRPGSWWEKVFAKEVYRFDNAQNCLRARNILIKEHGIDPGTHRRADVNLMIRSQQRQKAPEREPMPVPGAPPPPPLKRNRRIKLFVGSDAKPKPHSKHTDKAPDQGVAGPDSAKVETKERDQVG